MYRRIDEGMFRDAFRDHERQDQFSHEGLGALYDYLTDLEEDTGHEIELDVISLCCDWSEYGSALEAATEYGYEPNEEDDEEEQEAAALEWLEERTTVIVHDNGVIVGAF